MLTINIDYFKSKPVNIPKTAILLDNGYHPSQIESELLRQLGSGRAIARVRLTFHIDNVAKES